jgi:hypothetical protein
MRPLLALLLLIATASLAQAGTVFLGPSPYLSAADSPFDLFGLGTTFFLEDFEDGELNTPGISWHGPPGIVLEPGTLTDSVDGDDGVIDGYGNGGHSLLSRAYQIEFSNPPSIYLSVGLDFDADALGFAPTALGFAWTDGPGIGSVAIHLFDNENRLISANIWGVPFHEPLGDHGFDGATMEDRFYGVFEPSGFRRAVITTLTQDASVGSFELDHLQYGLIVPEPSGLTTSIFLISGALFCVRCFGERSKSTTQLG